MEERGGLFKIGMGLSLSLLSSLSLSLSLYLLLFLFEELLALSFLFHVSVTYGLRMEMGLFDFMA